MMNSMQAHNNAINRSNANPLGKSGFNNLPPPPFIHTPRVLALALVVPVLVHVHAPVGMERDAQ